MSYERTKKTATRFFNNVYIHEKNFGARARQISFRFENSKIIKIWSRRQNILQARVRKCTRGQNFFYHRIVHAILHLPDTLYIFISLKLIAVDVFKMLAFSLTKSFFQKSYQISSSSKNFAFWAMNKPKKLQWVLLTKNTFKKKNKIKIRPQKST